MILEPNKNQIIKMRVIEDCIHTLYNITASGGCCHIVTDDDNIEDDDLKWVIEYCERDENADKEDRFLSKFICEQLLLLSREYRIILFDMMFHSIYRNIDSSAIDIYFSSNDVDKVVRKWDEI